MATNTEGKNITFFDKYRHIASHDIVLTNNIAADQQTESL